MQALLPTPPPAGHNNSMARLHPSHAGHRICRHSIRLLSLECNVKLNDDHHTIEMLLLSAERKLIPMHGQPKLDPARGQHRESPPIPSLKSEGHERNSYVTPKQGQVARCSHK